MASLYCCDAFRLQATERLTCEGGGHEITTRFEPLNRAGVWGVRGCCDEDCWLIMPMAFCPYCGTSLMNARAGLERHLPAVAARVVVTLHAEEDAAGDPRVGRPTR